jgi:hypothetical protein
MLRFDECQIYVRVKSEELAPNLRAREELLCF